MKNLFTKLIDILLIPIKLSIGLLLVVIFALTVPIFILSIAIALVLSLFYKAMYLALFKEKENDKNSRDYVDIK